MSGFNYSYNWSQSSIRALLKETVPYLVYSQYSTDSNLKT